MVLAGAEVHGGRRTLVVGLGRAQKKRHPILGFKRSNNRWYTDVTRYSVVMHDGFFFRELSFFPRSIRALVAVAIAKETACGWHALAAWSVIAVMTTRFVDRHNVR